MHTFNLQQSNPVLSKVIGIFSALKNCQVKKLGSRLSNALFFSSKRLNRSFSRNAAKKIPNHPSETFLDQRKKSQDKSQVKWCVLRASLKKTRNDSRSRPTILRQNFRQEHALSLFCAFTKAKKECRIFMKWIKPTPYLVMRVSNNPE